MELKLINLSGCEYEVSYIINHSPKHETKQIINYKDTDLYYFISKNIDNKFVVFLSSKDVYKRNKNIFKEENICLFINSSFKLRRDARSFISRMNHELSLEFIKKNL